MYILHSSVSISIFLISKRRPVVFVKKKIVVNGVSYCFVTYLLDIKYHQENVHYIHFFLKVYVIWSDKSGHPVLPLVVKCQGAIKRSFQLTGTSKARLEKFILKAEATSVDQFLTSSS